ncbi:MAG: hypothetical protein K5643_06220 [Saccharofermentans sp.]|nr:hypothetical protein [Saccharofermentans sp.]
MGFYDFLSTCRLIIYPAVGIALLVFGILIIVKHKKNAMFPGLWVIICSIMTLPVVILNVLGKTGISGDVYGSIVTAEGIVEDLFAVLAIVVLFLHAKVIYRSKGLAAVIILSLTGVIIPRIVSVVIENKDLGSGALGFTYINYMITELFLIACYIIIMIAYIRGRDKDSVFSKLFLIPMFLMIINFIYLGVDSIVVDAAFRKDIYPEGVSGVYFFIGLLMLTLQFVAALVMLTKKKKKPMPQIQVVE